MNLIKSLEKIESPSIKDPNWYFHGFPYDEKMFADMLTDGIKCRFIIRQKGFTCNGPFYISLYKDFNPYVDQGHSAYAAFSASYPNFIIANINPIKCRNDVDYSAFQNTILPLRSSGLQDEYQQFWRIHPNKFIGIQCSVLNWYRTAQIANLKILKEIIKIMQEQGIDLPIYDFSRVTGSKVHIIDSSAYQELYPKIKEDIKEQIYSKKYK